MRRTVPRTAWWKLTDGSTTTLTAVDDGYGDPHPKPGHGLTGISERFEALGGAVIIEGSPRFRVTARVPI